MMREEVEIADEKRLAAKIIVQAKVMAPRLATMSAVSEHRSRWVTYKVCYNKSPGTTGVRGIYLSCSFFFGSVLDISCLLVCLMIGLLV